MKILYIYPSLLKCGPVNQMYYLISFLANLKEFNIHLFILNDKNIDNEELKKIHSLNINVVIYSRNINGVFKAYRDALKLDPDIIHSTLFYADLFAFLFFKNLKRVITFRTDPFDNILTQGKFLGNFIYKIHRFISQRTNFSVACSNAISNRFIKNNGYISKVIHNCIGPHFEIFDYCRVYKNIIYNKIINICVIGSLCNRKNPLMIVDICSEFSMKYGFIIKLDFYGEGILGNKISNLNLLGPQLKVRLCGHEPINSNLLSQYDLHISASYAEGLPNSVIETLSQGIPNFISSIDEHLEFKNYATQLLGYFNHSDDTDIVVTKLMVFILNLIDNKANSAREKFLHDFSRVKTAMNYIEIYKGA